jgi:nitrile hydratase alpha subunit
MKYEENARKIEKIIAKAWMDEGFKQRLLSDPAASLKEEGVEIPPGVEVRIVEDTDSVQHLVLPMKPSSKELSDEQLVAVAGGYCPGYCGTTEGPRTKG